MSLNTDCSAKGAPGLAGVGVRRDSRGRFIKDFVANFGMCNAYKAEIMADEMGLEMDVSMDI